MDEIKFSCPHCSQHIACESQWSGRQIQCPACQATLTIPSAPTPPAPAAAAPKVTKKGPSTVHVRLAHPPVRPHGPLPPSAAKDPKKALLLAAVAGVVVIAGIYLLKTALGLQSEANEDRKRQSENSGGQVAHIQELNQAVKDTEPGQVKDAPASLTIPQSTEVSAAPAAGKATPDQAGTAWTLDVETAEIAKDKASGQLSGESFTPDNVSVDITGNVQILTLRQGANLTADNALFIYLPLKAEETVASHTWTISKETTGAPQIVKRSKPSGQPAPKHQTFTSGYALKLEFGKAKDSAVPGKIYLALPDPEHSFVSGDFTATVRTVTLRPAAPPPTARVATNAAPGRGFGSGGGGRSQPGAPLPRPRNPGGGYNVPMPNPAVPF